MPRAASALFVVLVSTVVGCGPPPRAARSVARARGASGGAASASAPASANGSASRPAAVVYTVVSGDTLIALARRFHVAGGVDALVRLNALTRADRIRDGQGLLVPLNPPFTDEQPPFHPPARFEHTLRACRGLSRGTQPAEQPRPGCTSAACSRVGAAVEVCACAATDPTQSGFVVRDRGAERARWLGLPFHGDPTAFDVVHGDLDGDGAPETAVAVLESEADGLATRTWTLRVLGAAAPMRVRVDEYGEGTFLARGDGAPRPGCELLATEWTWLRDPLRGDGLYLLARRYALRAGALAPAGAPVLARRMLTDFRAEASADRPAPRLGAPAAWLGDGRAEVWPADPATDGRAADAREGELAAAAMRGDDPARQRLLLEVRWRDGTSSALEPRARGEADAASRYERLGDSAAGAVLPLGYAPAQPEAWRGATVRAAAHQDARGETHRVVWLGAPRASN